MTIAICIFCGNEKVGAWTLCPACASKPRTQDEAMLSLALSDWFFDELERRRWTQQIQAGIKLTLDDASRELLSASVTMFDEWVDVNAELYEAALEESNQRTFDASDIFIDAFTPPVPAHLYPSIADKASIAARHILSEFAATKKTVNSDTLSDPWIVGYISSALEWGLMGIGDVPTDSESYDETEKRFRLAFTETIVSSETAAIALLEKINQLEAAADSKFIAGRVAYGGVLSVDTSDEKDEPLTNYLNGVFVCWLCDLVRKRVEHDSDTCDVCGFGPPGLVYQQPKDQIEIEGARVVPWGAIAPIEDLELLADAEYADAENEYVLHQIDNTGLTISARNNKQELRRNWQFFCDGTFFLGHAKGSQLLQKIEDALSSADKEILTAREYLRRYGIITSELGGDLVVLKFYEILSRWDQRKDVPEGKDWQYMIDIFSDGSSQLMRKGASLVRSWVDHIEQNSTGGSSGKLDVYRRVGLAALYRHSGQFDKALATSEIVEFPMSMLGDKTSVAVLCTTRAATLMDMADHKPQQRAELLKSARLTLNKAHAMSGGESQHVLEAYRRLKRLDAAVEAEKQNEREAAMWRKIGTLPPEN